MQSRFLLLKIVILRHIAPHVVEKSLCFNIAPRGDANKCYHVNVYSLLKIVNYIKLPRHRPQEVMQYISFWRAQRGTYFQYIICWGLTLSVLKSSLSEECRCTTYCIIGALWTKYMNSQPSGERFTSPDVVTSLVAVALTVSKPSTVNGCLVRVQIQLCTTLGFFLVYSQLISPIRYSHKDKIIYC